jgi:hypothetical protein
LTRSGRTIRQETPTFVVTFQGDMFFGVGMAKTEDFVCVTGVVHLRTSLGVFLDIQKGRLFIPTDSTSIPIFAFENGETVTLQVLRSFAEHHGLAT